MDKKISEKKRKDKEPVSSHDYIVCTVHANVFHQQGAHGSTKVVEFSVHPCFLMAVHQ